MVVSQAQQGLAAMSRTARGRAILKRNGKKPMPQDVANEMMKDAKGKTNLPKRIRKKK